VSEATKKLKGSQFKSAETPVLRFLASRRA
jgi:hypothetical protein